MSDLSTLLHSYLPPNWSLSNLIFLDPDWQVNIADDEGVVVATGDTIEEALTTAKARAYEGRYIGKFKYTPALEAPRVDLTAILSRLILRPTIRRR